MSEVIKIYSIIINTGRNLNIVGKQIFFCPQGKTHAGGHKLEITPASKMFKFGRDENTHHNSMMSIPLNLASHVYMIEVYIVPSWVLFLVRGQVFRELKSKIILAPKHHGD